MAPLVHACVRVWMRACVCARACVRGARGACVRGARVCVCAWDAWFMHACVIH